jgi:hypothetical protein
MEVAISTDKSGYALSSDTTGLEIALRLNHLIRADSLAKRRRIEEQSAKDIERWLEALPDVKSSLPSTMKLIEGLEKYLLTERRTEKGSQSETSQEAARALEETRYLLMRLQDASLRSQELIFKLAINSTTASRESQENLSRELRNFLEFVGEINLRSIAAFENLGSRIAEPKLKSLIADLTLNARTTAELMRSINPDDLAKILYIAQEKARQARTALANRDSRVKAVLKSIYESQGKEPSVVDVKIGKDPVKLQKWLDEVFDLFVASRPKQRVEVLQKTYKKEWDIFTRSALYPAISRSDFTSIHEQKLQEFFSISNKWSAQKVDLDQFSSISGKRDRADFVHESGSKLDLKRKARDLIKTRLNPHDSLSFVFTFPASLSPKIDELEFKLLNASRSIPNIGKVEVSSRPMSNGGYELSIEFPATDSFESVEKLKRLMIEVVDPFLA